MEALRSDEEATRFTRSIFAGQRKESAPSQRRACQSPGLLSFCLSGSLTKPSDINGSLDSNLQKQTLLKV